MLSPPAKRAMKQHWDFGNAKYGAIAPAMPDAVLREELRRNVAGTYLIQHSPAAMELSFGCFDALADEVIARRQAPVFHIFEGRGS